MKKAICSAVSLFMIWANFCFAVIADPAQPVLQSSTSFLFNQTRIGLGFAAEYINYEATLKIQPLSGNLGTIQNNQSQIGRKFTAAPSIELGATIANNYYLGLLVSWHHVGIKDTSVSPFKGVDTLENESNLNQYIDILLKPGFKVTPRAMVYGLVGPSFADWSHTTNQYNGVHDLRSRFKIERKSIGLSFGLGFEYLFQKDFSISADYTHHLHRSVSKAQVVNTRYGGRDHSGNVLINSKPSYGTIAIRLTKFFSL